VSDLDDPVTFALAAEGLATARIEDIPADAYETLRDAHCTLVDVLARITVRLSAIESELVHPSQLPPVRRLRVVR
jgi:hypothetical protein